jgi:hypothetical protein
MNPLVDDSDGSEPEEIDVKATKEAIVSTFENQRNAIKKYNDLKRSKRQTINDKYCQQKTRKNETKIEKLSTDLLNDISMDGSDKKKDNESDPKDQTLVKRRAKRVKKSFGIETESTHFDVLDVNHDLLDLMAMKANDKNNGINFKDKMLFDRKRHKRLSSSAQKSYFDKQFICRK